MQSLTLDQKLKSYNYALNQLENLKPLKFESEGIYSYAGLMVCTLLQDYLYYHEKMFINTTEDIKYTFPEFYKFKPEGANTYQAWWRNNKAGLITRVKILKKCIEIVKAEMKKVNA